MTRNLFGTLMLWLLCTLLLCFCFIIVASAQDGPQPKARPAHLGLFYPISSNGVEAPQLTNNFSLHLIAGVSYQEQAFCLSGISNIVRHNAYGLTIAGISNHIQNDARGFQMAGILNQVKHNAEGVQVAGIANVSGNANGAQIAGFANVAKDAGGLQLAGFTNNGRNTGTQIAGFVNVAKTADALQLAGFANVGKDVNMQIAGFINVAKKVHGVQIAGLINIAEESDYPIGLINIIKNGEKQIGVSVDETGSTLVSFRSGGKVLYGIVGAGYNFNSANARYVLEGGMGAHLPLAKYLRLNFEAVSSVLSDLEYDTYMKSTARVLLAYKVTNRIELFAGPTGNFLNYERGQDDIRHDSYLWRDRGFHNINGIYLGAMGGIQFNL